MSGGFTVIVGPDHSPADVIDGKIQVQSVSQTALENISAEKGLAFAFNSNYATGGTDTTVLAVECIEVNTHMHFDQIWVSGSGAGVLTCGWMIPQAAALGGTTVLGGPMNFGLKEEAPATAFGNLAVTGTPVIDPVSRFTMSVGVTDNVRNLEGAWVGNKGKVFIVQCSTSITLRLTVIAHFDPVN